MSREMINNNLSIGLILGLITQGAAIVWTVSMMMSDIESNRDDILETQSRITRLESAVNTQAVSMARIDENIKAIRGAVEAMANRGTIVLCVLAFVSFGHSWTDGGNQLFQYCYYDCGLPKNGLWYDRVYRVSHNYVCPIEVKFK